MIENGIASSTTDTAVDIEIILVDISNTGVRVEITVVGVETPVVQDIYRIKTITLNVNMMKQEKYHMKVSLKRMCIVPAHITN